MTDARPVLGLMLGDATGIGPEISARVLASRAVQASARLVVVGDARVLELGASDAGVSLPFERYERVADVRWEDADDPDGGRVPLVDLANVDPGAFPRGERSAASGAVTGETLAHMIGMARAGELEGITFAPLNKAALQMGGWRYPDEHRMFADLTGTTGVYGEMNVLDALWTSRVTSHVPFREVLALLSVDRIVDAVRLAHDTLKAVGVTAPRIAVAALNPHAGEDGMFGDEEQTLIGPAVERAVSEGIDAKGPFPADTVFLKAFDGAFDSVVSMYHDQGQIATKLKGFNRGVTVTAGLEIPFTTPAHGTAFDIVGKGAANTGALEQALALCARLATSRRGTRAPAR